MYMCGSRSFMFFRHWSIYEDIVKYANLYQDRACRRTPYVMSICKRAVLRISLVVRPADPLCYRLTCTFLFSAFKLTDPALQCTMKTWLDVPFAQNFISFPLTCEYLFLLYPDREKQKEKCIPLCRGWFAPRARFAFFLFSRASSIMAYRWKKFEFNFR